MAEPEDGRPFGWRGLTLEYVRGYDGARALPAEWRSKTHSAYLLRCGRNDRDGYIASLRGVSKVGNAARDAFDDAIRALRARVDADIKFLEEFE